MNDEESAVCAALDAAWADQQEQEQRLLAADAAYDEWLDQQEYENENLRDDTE